MENDSKEVGFGEECGCHPFLRTNEINSLTGYVYVRRSLVVGDAPCPHRWRWAEPVLDLHVRNTTKFSDYSHVLRRAHPNGYLELSLEGMTTLRFDKATESIEGKRRWLFPYAKVEGELRRFRATRSIEEGMKYAPDEEWLALLSQVAAYARVDKPMTSVLFNFWQPRREVLRLLPLLSIPQLEDLAYAVDGTWQSLPQAA